MAKPIATRLRSRPRGSGKPRSQPRQRARALLVAGGWALATASCTFINAYEDPALVGDWESRDPFIAGDNSTKNSMTAELEGDGKATLYFQLSGELTVYSAKNKITWEQSDEEEFLIKFKCSSTNLPSGACLDTFYMECEADSAGDELECKCEDPNDCPFSAESRWEWERD